MPVRDSIKLMIKDGITPFAIVAAHGRFVNPDEAKLLQEYEKQLLPPPQSGEKGKNANI